MQRSNSRTSMFTNLTRNSVTGSRRRNKSAGKFGAVSRKRSFKAGTENSRRTVRFRSKDEEFMFEVDMTDASLPQGSDIFEKIMKDIADHLLEELTRRFNMDFIGFSTFWVSFTFPNKCVGVVNETSANTSSVNELSSR